MRWKRFSFVLSLGISLGLGCGNGTDTNGGGGDRGGAGTGGAGAAGGTGGSNGGAARVAQESGVTVALFGVSFADPDAGTVVGRGGTILRWTDGGGD